MKAIEIFPKLLKGDIKIPSSKSLCHRAIIAAALAMGQSCIGNVVLSEDILATVNGVQALGAKVAFKKNKLIIDGGKLSAQSNCIIDCNESGSTLRFLMPLGLLSESTITYIGRGNLGSRPLDPFLEIFKEQNIYCSDSKLPMSVCGRLKPGIFKIRGNISSQFITALLFALPLLEEASTIIVTEPLESRGYIDLTIDVLACFGISVENNNYQSFFINGCQEYKPTQYSLEGDYSQAAFWLSASALGSDLACFGLNNKSRQGDKSILDILKIAGAELELHHDYIKVFSERLKDFEVDASQFPDLVPVLAVVAALCEGTSRISNASRLRIKECDRLKAISVELRKLGAEIYEYEDGLVIKGSRYLKGGVVDSWGDHRIAMALAIAATRCIGPVIIHNSNAVLKSYPDFFEDYKMLGGNIHECDLG